MDVKSIILLSAVLLLVGCDPKDEGEQQPPAVPKKIDFGRVDIPGAGEPLMELVRETKDPDAKWRAIRALGSLRYKRAIPLLTACLKDDHHYVRANAARALGDMDAKSASQSLLELLEKEADGGVIEQASVALRRLNVREAVPVLKRLADHESEQTRTWVLQAIGELGSKEDVPFVAERLEAESELDRDTAARAIERLADVDFGYPLRSGVYDSGPLIDRAKAWWKENRAAFVKE